jgi:hypothetical protein
MISEELVSSVVRGVLKRLESESGLSLPASGARLSEETPSSPPVLEMLYQSYRTRYLAASPFEEKHSAEFDSSLPVELGCPLVCIYETHQPCDSCGRCQVRGF